MKPEIIWLIAIVAGLLFTLRVIKFLTRDRLSYYDSEEMARRMEEAKRKYMPY